MLLQDLSLHKGEVLVTFSLVPLFLLLQLGLVKQLLFVIVAQEFILKGSSALSLVVFLLSNLISYAI